MKILALFLSGFFLFSTGIAAQTVENEIKPCGFAPALKGFTVETRVWIDNKLIEEVSPQIVEMLEDGQNCLDLDVMRLDGRVKMLESLLESNKYLKSDILDLEEKLKQTEYDLSTAKERIDTLELESSAQEHFLTALMARRPASKPKAPVNKPKPAIDSPKDR